MLLMEKYELGEIIGQGGTGNVYRGYDRHLRQVVAVKQADAAGQEGKKADSLWNEARILNGMEHQALPKIYDFFREGEYVYVVLEYVQGVTLEEYVSENGPMEQQKALEVMKQLLSVFHYLHACLPPVIYCDLKPANIMLRADGRIKLIDFGAATAVYHKARAGTPGFSAPELLTGGWELSDCTERSDIFSLGAVFHFLLTGVKGYSLSYAVRPVKEYNRKISAGVERIVLKCMRPNRYRRYANVEQLKNELEQFTQARKNVLRRIRRFIRVVCLLLLPAGICMILRMAGDGSQLPVLRSGSNGEGNEEYRIPAALVGTLPVTVRDQAGYKLLIKEGTVYRPSKDIILELPLSGIPKGEEVVLQIILSDQKKRYESRKFLIMADQ